jgi:tRNA-specific 2-thiouridylase
VKFRDLVATARDLGAAALATGHYARRVLGPAGPELHRAADLTRDQSYFLFATTRPQLEFLRFPLGGLPKDETRAIAARFALPVAAKPDSQDICFVPSGSYVRVVEKLRPGAAEPGDIVHIDGTVLGRHEGTIHFTIGQRRGLGVSAGGVGTGEPLYVVRVDAATRRVVVGPKAALARDVVHVRDLNWLADATEADLVDVAVKLRSASTPVPAMLRRGTGHTEVLLHRPELGVAPGQACVIYRGDRVLGGGWIAAAEMSRAAAA